MYKNRKYINMITLKELLDIVKDDIRYAKILARNGDKEKALSYLEGAYRHISSLRLFNLDDESIPKIQRATARQKKRYTIYTTWVADSFSVAVNKLYGIDIEEGKEYTTPIIPWGVIIIDGKTYPVYADDPGQCDYIILDGEHISAGSYNFRPEGEFVYYIISHMYAKIENKIKGE